MADPQHFLNTSGQNDPVWVHHMPYSKYPEFPLLSSDIETDVCVIGSGVAGISISYELVNRGKNVTMIEARHVLSGESGRTSGHLSNALDDGYMSIEKKHGFQGAKAAADGHTWAINKVEEVSKKLGIECEFRRLPAYRVSWLEHSDPRHEKDRWEIQQEAEAAQKLGLDATYRDGLTIRGWDGSPDQRDGTIFGRQATFHPTKYFLGVLEWLRRQPNFLCFARTKMMSLEEYEVVKVQTVDKHTITAKAVVEATCAPLQKMSINAEMVYNRTYCFAIRIPKGSVEDCLIYDTDERYKYVRLTGCDGKDNYMVVGGCDHKVGQEEEHGRFDQLERWVRARFTKAGPVDYRWSGHIFEPVDYVGFIGKNQGRKLTYVVAGDSGNGLTHGVLSSDLIADEIEGKDNPWAALYNPSRLSSISKALPTMLQHDLQIQGQYKRYMRPDIQDIEDLQVGTGGVIRDKQTSRMTAVYKDEGGRVHRYSAVCPHMRGIVTWNNTEKSWDCPVHGSRFSCDGVCVEAPAKSNLTPLDDSAGARQRVLHAV
jgi:glycine/D-amino acid oxidase-like deaminating enzyme/nitrite reductase/ring-hydroxylating ferredoxin subunit